jgi:hypothetical protein
VARLAGSIEPPRYHREPAGSALDLEIAVKKVLTSHPAGPTTCARHAAEIQNF